MIKLYDYPRSTACYRVRLALSIKNLPYDVIHIHLVNNGGEHHDPKYSAINPQQLVPTAVINGQTITQSLAIIDFLEETFPQTPLLPANPLDRAQVRSLALLVACDMHPLNNLRVLNYLRHSFKASEEDVIQWYHHWLREGFNALESKLQQQQIKGDYCWGNRVSLADICLIPQIYNAHRFKFPMEEYPLLSAINTHCTSLIEFKKAAP